jgi:hypothetical protein
MKAPKVAPPPAQIAIPKMNDDALKKKRKTELKKLQGGTGRESTIFTPLNQSQTNRLGGAG